MPLDNTSFLLYIIVLHFIIYTPFFLYLLYRARKYEHTKEKMFQESLRNAAQDEPLFIRWLTRDEKNTVNRIGNDNTSVVKTMCLAAGGINLFFLLLPFISRSWSSDKSSLFLMSFLISIILIPLVVYYMRIRYFAYLDTISPVLRIKGPLEKEVFSNLQYIKESRQGIILIVRSQRLMLTSHPSLTQQNFIELVQKKLESKEDTIVEYTPYMKLILSIR